MFDITSFIREKIFRRPKLVTPFAGEELSEKQTTKLWYFLLYCMFGAILASAQWTLSIIQDIPEKPTPVPSCITRAVEILTPDSKKGDRYYYNTDYTIRGYNECLLVSVNPRFDFTDKYDAIKDAVSMVDGHNAKIQSLESQKQQIIYRQRNTQQDYNTSLAEKTVNEDSRLYNTQEIQQNIKSDRSEVSSVEAQINELKNQITGVQAKYSTQTEAARTSLSAAENDYKNAYFLYNLYVAILSFLFALIVFVGLYKIYIRQKIANSPYTIIFSAATFAYGIVLLQVSALFIWDIIPHKLLQWIGNLFVVFTPLVYIVQFLWPVFIIAIFGYAVFKIQKRLYSPQNVLKRFITDKKCPGCGNAVDFTKPFCPLCSHEIQIHCPHCHELSLKGMPFCSNCGGKLPEKDIISYGWNKVFDDALEKELQAIDIHGFSWVSFIPKNGASFVSNRENIVRMCIYMTGKVWKTSFEADEFAPYLDKILMHIKDESLEKSELKRVLWKIRSWVASGGEIVLIKK